MTIAVPSALIQVSSARVPLGRVGRLLYGIHQTHWHLRAFPGLQPHVQVGNGCVIRGFHNPVYPWCFRSAHLSRCPGLIIPRPDHSTASWTNRSAEARAGSRTSGTSSFPAASLRHSCSSLFSFASHFGRSSRLHATASTTCAITWSANVRTFARSCRFNASSRSHSAERAGVERAGLDSTNALLCFGFLTARGDPMYVGRSV